MTENSTTPILIDNVVSIAKPYRLQFEDAQDSWVLLYPEGMVKLNGPAGEILSRCDGDKAVRTVVEELEAAFEQPDLQADVLGFLAIALDKRWISLNTA